MVAADAISYFRADLVAPLLKRAGQRATNGVLLPPGHFHQLGKARSARTAKLSKELVEL